MLSNETLKERFSSRFRRRFLMSEFVRNSLQALESIVDEGLLGVAPEARIGVYGNQEAATVIHLHLLRRGRKNIFFIAKNHHRPEYRDCLIVDVSEKEVHSAEVVFTTSLSRSVYQQNELLKHGYSGKIVCLPDLRHLSVELLRDSATNREISRLVDRHRNQPAFVIGNGPSLNQTDPRLIDESFVCFAGNGIVNYEGFCPDYYFILDMTALGMWTEQISALRARRFFPARMNRAVGLMEGFGRASDVFFPMSFTQKSALDVFSWRQQGFESGHTIVSPMLQFALLMGCRPIYLIGVDVSYSAANDYFTSGYHPEGTPGYLTNDTERINQSISRGIERAVTACRRAGVEVYNCAPTKNLPILENLEFQEVLKR